MALEHLLLLLRNAPNAAHVKHVSWATASSIPRMDRMEKEAVGPRWKTSSCVAFLTLPCLLAQGCSSMRVKMGWRVDLNKTPVSSIQASLPKGPAIAPGEKSPLVVTLTQPNGQVLLTEGQGAGKVM